MMTLLKRQSKSRTRQIDITEEMDIGKKKKILRSFSLEALIAAMLGVILIVYFWENIVIVIPPGNRGVLFKSLGEGTVVNKSYGEGLNIIFPWDKMTIYDTRILAGQDSIDALTQDGLSVRAEISYRYIVNADSLGSIQKNIGENYKEKIIVPLATAATREIVSRFRVEALFTTARKEVQDDMFKRVRSEVDAHYPIVIVDLVIRNIAIDKTVEQSIADKLVKEQEMLSYDFILKKEAKEKDRKLIEASGIKLFRDTSGVNFLTWKGIEATKELANSANSKVIVIGSGKTGLPIILGGN